MRTIHFMRVLGLALVAVTARAEANPATANQKPQGQALYETKCAKCHKLYEPALYSEPKWQSWMGKMSRKARLTPAEAEILKSYLAKTYRGSK